VRERVYENENFLYIQYILHIQNSIRLVSKNDRKPTKKNPRKINEKIV